MELLKRVFFAAVIFCAANIWGETTVKEPHIGYLYPAGGQQGTTVQVTAGGLYLRGVNNIYVSGQGISASVVKYQGRLKALNQEQREELRRRLGELRQKKMGGNLPGKNRPGPPFKIDPDKKDPNKRDTNKRGENAPAEMPAKPVELPDHPLLRNLDKLSLEGLQKVAEEFGRPNLLQATPQIAETVVIEIKIDSDAAPGYREIRLGGPNGLTNPIHFQVSVLPEIREPDFNDPGMPVVTRVNIPVVLNGQILPGEVDRFRFRATRGQHIVIEAQARRLIPYLGDAVPGWFQAAMKLYDASGKEVAYADDFRFDPDPVLYYEIPREEDYVLEINDAIYRGREDFVYRVAIGEQPFITQIFPLGARVDTAAIATVSGWNLPDQSLKLDTKAGAGGIRRISLQKDGKLSNSVIYAVDDMPECVEVEGNNTTTAAQKIVLPIIVNGRIESSEDKDVFRFDGRAGQDIVVEVYARRLNSPLDSLMQLTDEAGKVLASNDDHEDKESGLLTHYADSCLSAKLPKDGVYYVHLADTEHHGGEDYGYRLRIGPPQPDFSVYVNPSSVNVPADRIVPISVHVFRKEGFEGDIELVLKDSPEGFVLDGGRVPSGRDAIRMTLTAPQQLPKHPVIIGFEGQARIGGQLVRRSAVACEDMMQAFIYRHLVASQELMVAAGDNRRTVRVARLSNNTPVRMPAGGSTKIHVEIPPALMQQNFQLTLSNPPDGISLEDVTADSGGLAFVLKVNAQKPQIGFADNLIVEISGQVAGRSPAAGVAKQKEQRVSFGVLPAIPIEIVKP
ncbi:MAG: hypothetical protein FJ263_05200 [Planctomycetes bacterium]|nr:hypothetical protein [Planctomycetota bacterium]